MLAHICLGKLALFSREVVCLFFFWPSKCLAISVMKGILFDFPHVKGNYACICQGMAKSDRPKLKKLSPAVGIIDESQAGEKVP
jgi:hypothetical protein